MPRNRSYILLALPVDLFFIFSDFLNPKDLVCLLSTCKALRAFNHQRSTWLAHVRRLMQIHAIPKETYDVPTLPPLYLRAILTWPNRFQSLCIQGRMARTGSAKVFKTRIQAGAEVVDSAQLVPGGRWLVTVSHRRDEDEEVGLERSIIRVLDLHKRIGRGTGVDVRVELFTKPIAWNEVHVRADPEGDGILMFWYHQNREAKSINVRVARFRPNGSTLKHLKSFDLSGPGFDWTRQLLVQGELIVVGCLRGTQNLILNWRTDKWTAARVPDNLLHDGLVFAVRQDGLVVWNQRDYSVHIYGPLNNWASLASCALGSSSPRFTTLLSPVTGMQADLLRQFISEGQAANQPFYPFYHTSRPWRLNDAPSLLVRVKEGFAQLSFDPIQVASDRLGWVCSFVSADGQRALPGASFWSMGNGTLLVPARNGILTLKPPKRDVKGALGSSVSQDWPDWVGDNGLESIAFACPLSGVVGRIRTMDTLAVWELH